MLCSSDHGTTWQIGAVDTARQRARFIPTKTRRQNYLDGRIYVNVRDQHGTNPATRAVAYCSDGGMSFDAPFMAEPNITTTVVQNSVIRFVAKDEVPEDNILIYSCPGDLKARQDLTLLVSLNEGRSWSKGMLLHEGPAAYSDLVQLDDRRIGVLYEAGETLYDRIEFATVVLDELTSHFQGSLALEWYVRQVICRQRVTPFGGRAFRPLRNSPEGFVAAERLN